MKLDELIALLRRASCVDEIDKKRCEIEELIPQVSIMFDFDQQNEYHQYDLWTHCLYTVVNLPRNLDDDMLYLAALLHDIGKPSTQCRSNRSEDVNMHYYGHPEKSCEIVNNMIIPELERKGMEFSEVDRKRLMYYILFHDDRLSKKLKHINRHMKVATWNEFQHLMLLQVADASAHVLSEVIEKRINICMELMGEEGELLYRSYLANDLRRK